MTALNDAQRAVLDRTTDRSEHAVPQPVRQTSLDPMSLNRTSRYSPAWLPSRRFIAAVIAIGGMQLMATMDGTIAIVALPKIQNELGLSDAGRSWVITAYVLTFGGLMLLGGRLGDTIGRKRTFVVGVTLFTIASALCGIAWDEATLVTARLLQGVAAAIASPTGLALIATTFPRGPGRNVATAVFGAMTGVGSVMGLVVGGALTEVSWRLAFVVNVPIGLVMIYLARTTLRETVKERMKLDAAGAVLATLTCTAAVFAFSMGPEKGWISVTTIGSAVVGLVAFVGFAVVERSAENPVVPFDLFFDRNRLATFAAIFLGGGVLFTLTVLIGLYVQDIMGYSALRAGIGFIPFAIAMGIGMGASSQAVSYFPPRVVVIAGGTLVVGAMLYGSTLNGGIPYFPNLVVPIVVGGIGIGMIIVPLALCAIAGVGFDRIGPTSAITLMLQNLGGPVVLAVIQAVITSRTLYLGGTSGPVKYMNKAQLHALDHGYTYGLLWVAGVALLVGAIALFIGYTAAQVAKAQEVQHAFETGEL
ncbi:MFS transporter [Mycobacterium shimoidei]|uniref:Putative integral membrane efflux protein EfpA [Mycobacterium tuberculosis H37Rv] n=2 Tax=Mycobacterium shimoidei TaxID=29313 RepID=A0A1E3SX74_MYCSH|nr:MFS transporter [Mycobacterium shimoidei]MCV7261338.1 MFS transporter [Mycobacterium shimoidei]ODR06756.1 MFS transporter [Mycobacterium shimoidei]ORW83164.1 MFS transporter [Mycobacterium shimoidei]SRX95850.1 putative integral membrane efflux protein EfpA [Mycobacterium tuberculosis H37Rv] [Mycobacterium shimoidei]